MSWIAGGLVGGVHPGMNTRVELQLHPDCWQHEFNGAVLILAKCEVIIILTIIINVGFLLLVIIVIDASWWWLVQLQVMAHSVSTGCEVL